jgi:VanZ family protein
VRAVDEKRVPLVAVVPRRVRPSAVAVAWAPVLAWMAVIVFLSGDRFADATTATWLAGMPFVGAFGISPAVIATTNLIVRKCAHFVEYAVLAMLCVRAARITWPALGRWPLMAAALGFAALVASGDELRQFVLSTLRTGAAHDVLLDAAGAMAGAAIGVRYLEARGRWRRP